MGLIEQMTTLEVQDVKARVGMAVMKDILDTQRILAAELFRSLGLGTRLDVRG